MIDELAEAFGSLDVLVNNAGTGVSTPFLEQSFDDWRHALAVDLDGAFLWGPLGRPGDAREVAAVIAQLCAPETTCTTGMSYVVDGGLLLVAAAANQ